MGAGKGPFTGYPSHVFLILGNEFCERFSFYGMKAILVLFLTRALDFSDDAATSIYHGFNVACYFMPIFGAMIADGWLGKYKTIFIISIVYGFGNVVMAVGAIPMDSNDYITALPFIGLILIAVGTGGIKPCVSAFGADQFADHQNRQKETFFSMFYMAINLGSLLSMIITPSLRSQVYCFGDNCYALAFGIPAILMIVAIIFFIAGSSLYTKPPPGDNVIGNLFGCIGTALKGKCGCSGNKESRDHWLDYADSKYSKPFIEDVKAVMRVLFMFLPLPIFWALFDQQGSRWTLQAGQMDGDLGGFVLEPDLIQVFNPLLVVTIVPLLESVVFPCLDKCKIPNRPLHRLGLGMFLAGTAFIIAAFIQIAVDDSLPAQIDSGNARLTVLNTVPCNVQLSIEGVVNKTTIEPNQAWAADDFKAMDTTVEASFMNCGKEVGSPKGITRKLNFTDNKAYNLIFATEDKNIQMYSILQTDTKRTTKGEASMIYMNTLDVNISTVINDNKVVALAGEASGTVRVKHAKSTAKFKSGSDDLLTVTVDAKAGAFYTVVIHQNSDLKGETYTIFDVVTANSVSILLQIPQYFVMSLGECFFSVTGLSFAYSQAPASMKAVLQAAWLLTNSFGNLIVMIISAVGQLPSQTAEFFLFAGLMYVTVIVFAIMSLTYEYVQPTLSPDEEEEKKEPENGYQNYGLTPDDEKPPTYEAVTDSVDSTYM